MGGFGFQRVEVNGCYPWIRPSIHPSIYSRARKHARLLCLVDCPTDPPIILKSQMYQSGFFEQHKIRRTTDFEAMHLLKVRSGP